MRKVDKADFYREIYSRNLNVHPFIQPGPWPWTTIWRDLGTQAVFGKNVDHANETSSWFLSE